MNVVFQAYILTQKIRTQRTSSWATVHIGDDVAHNCALRHRIDSSYCVDIWKWVQCEAGIQFFEVLNEFAGVSCNDRVLCKCGDLNEGRQERCDGIRNDASWTESTSPLLPKITSCTSINDVHVNKSILERSGDVAYSEFSNCAPHLLQSETRLFAGLVSKDFASVHDHANRVKAA